MSEISDLEIVQNLKYLLYAYAITSLKRLFSGLNEKKKKKS